MVGVKGQKNPSRHKRSNGWTNGTQPVIRATDTITFRPYKEMGDFVSEDMAHRQLSKQQWGDEATALMLGLAIPIDVRGKICSASLSDSLLKDVIETAIASKQAAIRAERKKKASQRDQALIGKWIAEIDELKLILPS